MIVHNNTLRNITSQHITSHAST